MDGALDADARPGAAAGDPRRLDAELYDARGIGWPGEHELYRQLADAEAGTGPEDRGVLEVACGTGRVAIDLATRGFRVTGLDRSPEMIEVARTKHPVGGPSWLVADMRTFRLGERFGLILVPGHSFQFMLTADDQVRALRRIRDHLEPGGLVCIHLDHPSLEWLASLPTAPGTERFGRPVVHPTTGDRYRLAYAWTFERATQTATVHMTWESLDADDVVTRRTSMPAMPLHVPGRVEMEHVLRRSGLAIEALAGDFSGGPFADASPEMIWFARRP